ncbi:MAG TPA: hypothetical protein VMT46_04065 [Anaerolineaceae bacterium]|nr:hypothetical protein [Anaerolineaceae bacterium]
MSDHRRDRVHDRAVQRPDLAVIEPVDGMAGVEARREEIVLGDGGGEAVSVRSTNFILSIRQN